MKDLSKISGLPIKLNGSCLEYDRAVFETEPQSRTYEEAKPVYLEKGLADRDLYYMYRYFEKRDDEQIFEESRAEYDITVIKPGKIGPEMIKTVGHYHAAVPNTDITYPEVYEVLEGEITYLLQTEPDEKNEVDIVIVEAKTGDKVIVPPGYGHVSINRSNVTAVSSNIQRRDLPASANYDAFKEKNGAALYYDGKDWTENYNYTIRSKKIVTPKEKPDWGLEADKPLYRAFIEDPDKFKWLTEPQNYDFNDTWR